MRPCILNWLFQLEVDGNVFVSSKKRAKVFFRFYPMKLGQNQQGYLYFYRNRKQDDLLLKFSDLHILCEALKVPTYLLTSIDFFFNQSYVHIWKQNIPNFNQMMLFFQSNPFLFQLEPIAWFYIDNIPNAHANSGPEEQFWNWLGPITPKQSMSKKRGKTIITLHTFRGTTDNLSQARPPDYR